MTETKKLTNIEYLSLLQSEGRLQPLLKKGIVPPHFITWMDIYSEVSVQLKTNSKSVACQFVADKYKLSKRHIERIIEYCETIS